ncbi:hypothetical protein [Aeromicrobium sp.]|uniref:hypothetical protein n=1 Tax=Aeromicrobium sp. TaxID=1871063 RepID=UPI003D6AF34D
MSLRPLSDASAGEWLSSADPALGPIGFDAYVRVLHPWTDTEDGQDRIEGHLPEDLLAALVDVLARHTETPDDCFHALWDGYGDLLGGEAVGFLSFAAGPAAWPGRVFTKPKPPTPPPPAFAPEVMDGPRLTVAGREHLLFTGPVADAGQWGAATYGHGIPRDLNSPNLLWPADHAWCVATDIDTRWTGVGGPAALADDLLGDQRLEVVRTRYESGGHR